MAINPELLVASIVLQQYLVDKDTGGPLTNGRVSLYQDTNRSIYKNWYYQTGSPGAYTYIPLDNPLYLSSVGTIQDPNGNDIIPFYYPWNENDTMAVTPQKYYVTVYSTDENSYPAVLQFSRENWPPDNGESGGSTKGNTLRNYILNNVFWRNNGENMGAIDVSDSLNAVVCPSQHDGYNNDLTTGQSDIRFIKNQVGASDSISFLPMLTATLGTGINANISPEYYMRASCTAVTTGETYKFIQYPISLHLRTLSNVTATLVVWARNSGGSAALPITFYACPYFGSGSTAFSYANCINIGSLTLNSAGNFQEGVFPFTFSYTGNTTTTGDDAWFLVMALPLDSIYTVDHTKFQLYLGDAIATNDFDTYDQIEPIINSPRTGDIRTSLNTFAPMGWVPMNDGTIGNSSSNASTRQNVDAWQLFNLIWTQMKMLQLYAPMYSSAGASIPYGVDALADWIANNQLSLTKSLGRVLAGSASIVPDAQTFTTDFAVDNTLLTVTTASTFGAGSPVILTNVDGALPIGLSTDTVYYSVYVSATTLKLTLQPFAASYVTFSDDGTGTSSIQVFSTPVGVATGETAHTQTIAEIATHDHAAESPAVNLVGTGGTFNVYSTVGANAGTLSAATAPTGSSTPFNVLQPTTFMNVFIKL